MMAYGILDMWEEGMERKYEFEEGFVEEYEEWAGRVVPKRGYNFVSGTVQHQFHGEVKDRGYSSRWGLLEKFKYNPKTDLKWN